MLFSVLSISVQNLVHFHATIVNLNQGDLQAPSTDLNSAHPVQKGRFNIAAFARAKKIAKEELTGVAVKKSEEISKLKDNCSHLEKEIASVKHEVCCNLPSSLINNMH